MARVRTRRGETRAMHGCAALTSPLGGLYATLGYTCTAGRRFARRSSSPANTVQP